MNPTGTLTRLVNQWKQLARIDSPSRRIAEFSLRHSQDGCCVTAGEGWVSCDCCREHLFV